MFLESVGGESAPIKCVEPTDREAVSPVICPEFLHNVLDMRFCG